MNPLTHTHASALRDLLDALEDNQNARSQLALRARRLEESDDIKPQIMRQATGIERWTEVEPSMFEDTLDREMSKYDSFKDGIEEGAERQADLLEQTKVRRGDTLHVDSFDGCCFISPGTSSLYRLVKVTSL